MNLLQAVSLEDHTTIDENRHKMQCDVQLRGNHFIVTPIQTKIIICWQDVHVLGVQHILDTGV